MHLEVHLAILSNQASFKILVQVLEVDDEDANDLDSEVHLNFMHKSGRLYTWPQPQDKSWQPRCDVVSRLSAPVLTNERAQFSIDLKEVKEIERQCKGEFKKITWK